MPRRLISQSPHAARLAGLAVPMLVALTCFAIPAPARAADDALDAAAYLFEQAVTPRRDGKHHRLLRALRHLEDPDLAPLFIHLSESDRASLQVHGMLGLAEISPEGKLDLDYLMRVDRPALQAELVSSALDADLMTLDDCARVLRWEGLDDGVKLVVATRLVAAGRYDDAGLLRSLLDDDKLGRRAVAAALLVQLGEPEGLEALRAISRSELPGRDQVESTVFRMALQRDLDRLGPWAYEVADAHADSFKRRLSALRVALRFGVPEAGALWVRRFRETEDAVARLQLGMALLQMSPWVDPALFEPMVASGAAVLAQAGRAGRAIAADDPRAVDALYDLVLMRYPLVNGWAMHYARTEAASLDGQVILLGMIQACVDAGDDRGRSQLLSDAVEATRALFEINGQAAARMLRPLLARPDLDDRVAQAILLGLVRTQDPAAGDLVADLPLLRHPDAAGLQVLLLAKHGRPLDARETNLLRNIVRGGGAMQDTLRIQAAWALLKRGGQTDAVLARLFNR